VPVPTAAELAVAAAVAVAVAVPVAASVPVAVFVSVGGVAVGSAGLCLLEALPLYCVLSTALSDDIACPMEP